MMNGANQSQNEDHPMCFNPIGSIQAVHMRITNAQANGDWTPGFAFGTNVPDINGIGVWQARAAGGGLYLVSAGTWVMYRFIVEFLAVSPQGQLRVYPQIYAVDGTTLLCDINDWFYSNFPQPRLQDWYSESSGLHEPASWDAELMRTPSWGMGQSGTSNEPFYIGAVAARTATNNSDFIGPI